LADALQLAFLHRPVLPPGDLLGGRVYMLAGAANWLLERKRNFSPGDGVAFGPGRRWCSDFVLATGEAQWSKK